MATKWRIKKETRGDGSVLYIPQYRFLWWWRDGQQHTLYDSHRATFAYPEYAQELTDNNLAIEARSIVVFTSIEG